MNDFIKLLKKRTSIRSYISTETIHQEKLDLLIEVINSSPTSMNGQYFGCVLVTDKKLLDDFNKVEGFQKHVSQAAIFAIFFIENNKLLAMESKVGLDSKINRSSLFTIGTIDATISATQLHDAAISLGLGTCFNGMIRAYPKNIWKKLGIPSTNTPVIALTIGAISTEEEIKPKMNKVFINSYSKKSAIDELHSYDDKINKYYGSRNNSNKNVNFSESIINFYQDDKWDKDWRDMIFEAYKIK